MSYLYFSALELAISGQDLSPVKAELINGGDHRDYAIIAMEFDLDELHFIPYSPLPEDICPIVLARCSRDYKAPVTKIEFRNFPGWEVQYILPSESRNPEKKRNFPHFASGIFRVLLERKFS